MIKNSIFSTILLATVLTACNNSESPSAKDSSGIPIQGTWQLLAATTIEKGDTTNTDYTRDQQMIKIINGDHFAFLHHDLSKGKDSVMYYSGGGSYTLTGDQYTEHLDFCSDKQWEGHVFPFTVTIKNDTLVQTGVEKVEGAGVNRINIEKYKRLKN